MTSKTLEHMGISSVGLSSKQALIKLRSDIEEELDKYQGGLSFNGGLVPAWVCDAFHHASPHATFPWTSALVLLGDIFLLAIFQIYGDAGFRMRSLAVETTLLSLLLLHNVGLVAWDSRLRHSEMLNKMRHTLRHNEGQRPCGSLHSPPSPCISCQWTFRDGRLLPLPSSLLVEGDVLLMRPGHPAPGRCLRPTPGGKEEEEVLESGHMFAPSNEDQNCDEDFFHSPRLRCPARPAKFVLMETPCLSGIRCALENSLKRPVTLFNKEYHAVVFYYMERIVLPSIIVVLLCAGSLRAVYFGWGEGGVEWAEHLLLRPVLATLPLLPLTLPLCWTLLNAAGNARLLASVHFRRCKRPVDPFDESEEETGGSGVEVAGVPWREVRGLFASLLLGGGGHLWRSANLLQVLGSITALCCVDKKGVLSWPNPTAEKVFFLRGPRGRGGSSEDTCPSEEDEGAPLPKRPSRPDVKDHIYHSGSQAEVLDLTHNLHSPFGIQFDDPNWKIYADNLKPLGLGILLNTCNPQAQEHYTSFSDHIACESLYNESAIPVVNKRCLCELAKQIGFVDSVMDYYDLQQLLGVFRHVHPVVVQKGARSLNFPRLKMPFPNMTCAILKDLHRGSQQLFSQGTADLILDACSEYWDGSDIRPLMDTDRKRILDFYHRSSLTAHCMGYAYSPLNNNNICLQLPSYGGRRYVELPAEGHHLLASLEANTASPRSWDPPCPTSREGGVCSSLHRHLSSDSLVEQAEEGSLEASLRQLGNGIFIGMVTMQYQACPDFVQLIEQLDKACIRFVHFSKENELRSRVFSEKMGLESGWNCHISLLSGRPNSESGKAAQTPKFSHYYAFPTANTEESLAAEIRNEITCRHASAPSVIHLESGDTRCEEIAEESASTLPPARVVRAGSLSEGGPRRDSSSLLSHTTESTEQSAPVTFDMSNRAKLPKGVENIRPHIEHVDNVPLQVSLFTDCTEGATREMVEIMQEYGEVVCCVGSASNARNPPLFLQADASIAVEPLVPQVCSQQREEEGGGGGLSSSLNSLPCCLLFQREDPVSLHHLIMEARQFTCGARNSLEFLVCCSLCLVGVQVAGAVFLLPLPLPSTHLLWMNCVELPLLSCSLLLDDPHPLPQHARTLSTGKNLLKATNRQAIILFCTCFCVRFCPSAVVAFLSFVCILSTACSQLQAGISVCWTGDMAAGRGENDNLAESWFAALTVSQNIFSFFLITYFAVISVSYLHRSRPPWKSSPHRSKYWMGTVLAVLLLHLVLCVGDVCAQGASAPLSLVPEYVWLVGGLWPLLAVPINELVRRHEIRVNVRQQKRARLEFCTKLGMNSPF